MRPITTSVSETINAPLARTFAGAAGFDVPATMLPHGPLPGVKTVEGHKAAYSGIGQVRELTLTDGSTVREETTSFVPNRSFAYRIGSFTGAFKSLVAYGEAEWRFTELGPAQTRIDWRYAFTPKSAAAMPIVWLIVKGMWGGYMGAALKRVKAAIERAP
jgi:hypothetical protein